MADHVEPTQDESIPVRKRKVPRVVFIVGGCLLIGGIGLSLFLLSGSDNKSDAIRGALKEHVEATTTFPLYYPTHMPDNLQLQEKSVGSFENQAVHFTLNTDNGQQIVITEQAKPAITEELTKIKEFTTPIGKAYLANLAGRTAGFIFTADTLIIFNTVGDVSTTQLEQVMQGMATL